MSKETEVVEWTLDGVLDELQAIDRKMKDRQFAFVLGSGASFKSGIPTGHQLAQQWLKELHLRECTDGSDVNDWATSEQAGIKGLTFENAAEFYPQIFERRFRSDKEAGYAALENAMEGKSPSLGYSLLAEIIQRTRHKVVVTTNFDNLVADALAMHAHQSPLVVAHESLTGFVRPQLRRPLVAKIHRDLFFNPKNDSAGVAHMEESWKVALKKLFQYFTPVVVGYGGNDGSLMDMLESLEQGDIVGQIFWCCREGSTLPEKAKRVLRKHEGIKVTIAGFDEFFVQLAAKLIPDFDVAQIAESIEELGKKRAASYRDQIEDLQKSEIKNSSQNRKASDAILRTRALKKSWWAWELEATEESDIEKRNLIYQQGLKQFPQSAELVGNYALFLGDVRKDFGQAEALYKKALELDPAHANNTSNYALFLANTGKDFGQAEALYKKALELDPADANIMGNYANFLCRVRKDFGQAEALYKKALELDPAHANNTSNYALFLANTGKDFDQAEMLYKKALGLDPTHANIMCNYASFLADGRKDFDQAEALYKKALELDPTHANIMGNYASFLADFRKDFDQAEALFKKALELDPTDANIMGNYASFLADDRKDFDQAEGVYKKTLELDPTDANALANYASILVMNDANAKRVIDCAKKVVDLSNGIPNQPLAEALFYGDLAETLSKTSNHHLMARLKGLLELGYERGVWSFEPVFDCVLPSIPVTKHALYRAIGDAILDNEKLFALNAFDEWKAIKAISPFTDW